MDAIIAEILKAGLLGALLLLQGWYFVRKETKLLESLEKKDASRKIEQEEWDKKRDQFEKDLVEITREHTIAAAKIAESIECLNKTSEKLDVLCTQIRYLRLFQEKVMRIRQPGQTEKFYAPENNENDDFWSSR